MHFRQILCHISVKGSENSKKILFVADISDIYIDTLIFFDQSNFKFNTNSMDLSCIGQIWTFEKKEMWILKPYK